MTEQRHKTPNPKDEFIITREQMGWIREGTQMDVIDTLEDVFTRPAPSADAVLDECKTKTALLLEQLLQRSYKNDGRPIIYLQDLEYEFEIFFTSLRAQHQNGKQDGE